MLRTSITIATGFSLCFLPILGGLFGLVVSKLFPWTEQQLGPWILRAGFAALAAPSVEYVDGRIQPVPALYPLLKGRLLESSGALSFLSMCLILVGVMSYYEWFHRRRAPNS